MGQELNSNYILAIYYQVRDNNVRVYFNDSQVNGIDFQAYSNGFRFSFDFPGII